jgi:hypothetical protein
MAASSLALFSIERIASMKISIVLTLLLTVAALCSCKDNWQEAEQSAKEYVKKLPGATGEVECAHKDSDGDGYCSCSAFMKDGSITALDCGCERYCYNCATGCKKQLQFKSIQR